MERNPSNENQNREFLLRNFIDHYLIHWRWFLIGTLISFIIAFIYLRYTTPQFKATAIILVKDEKKGGMLSELSAFSDMGIESGLKNNLDNETEILKSRTLIENTVKKLHLNISIFIKGNIIYSEMFKEKPINIHFIPKSVQFYETNTTLRFIEISPTSFQLENQLDSESSKNSLLNKNEFQYGELITTQNWNLVITKNPSKLFKATNREITIQVNPMDEVVDGFRNRLTINPLSKTSSVVELSLVDPVYEKAEIFLDNLIQIYNQDAITDKNQISENTSKFIAERLSLITRELDGVEQDVESFKKTNNLTDIDSEAKLFIEGSNTYDKKAVETEIQLNVVNSMLDYIKKSNTTDLLPTNLIGGEEDAASIINMYNELVLDRNRILKSATPANPTVLKMDQQIVSLKQNLLASLDRLKSSLIIQKRDLDSHKGIMDTKIEKIPVQERQFKVIARQQKIKEELYLYLLQKREETAISLSATEPNARVIDAAKASHLPVAPKKKIIYLVAFLIGILIPFGIIYLIDLLDTKIKSRLDLEGKTTIPYLGDIPTSDANTQIIKSESRTSSAEALRIIRTNLEFMLSKVPENQAKTLFLTSTFSKEGKTFVSVNLAATFALSGKKVLLIGMDIRNPKLDDYISLPDQGLTNYLSNKDIPLEDLIIKQKGYEHFYILPAGLIPPNPAELLLSQKVDTLFKTIKAQYDYIIVDTAPVSLVTDTLLIAKHADCFLFVIRANFLEKRMLNIANDLYMEKKLPNMCLLLNDTDSTKGYGYGYGYGIKAKKRPWYKKLWAK
ncbi:capsular exopolysaccharide synthesis family protein [Flavobacterium sp. 103]|uniref:GumC family protein n=1 Tax=unclassified Flavobacterium TaxID=196869 RepID=UPI000D5DCD73|nr:MULTISPECIES: tyrosine-protein kinase [unclassified Flavobacterium]PVX47002.1 capsular exopolysaccharide synthesis family protein [Flavobacterium sp. 103]QKJ64463.1 polysaccharide biosynthesis tyrosine autokinase [Flavobacterium sp. M31R6]